MGGDARAGAGHATRTLGRVLGGVLGLLTLAALVSAPWVLRRHPDTVVDWPGGPDGYGLTCGVLSLLGAGAVFGLSPLRPRTPGRRAARGGGMALGAAVAAVATMYAIIGVGESNCAHAAACRSVPGAEDAAWTYLSTVLVGLLLAGATVTVVLRARRRRR